METVESECIVDGFHKDLYISTRIKLSKSGQHVVTKFEIKTPQENLPRFIARKVIPISKLDDGDDRREYMILKKCKHENILKLYAWEQVNHIEHDVDYFHIYTELCDQNLRAFMEENDKLTPNNVEKMTIQLINGCEYLHNMGIVHRDIKPENILVNKTESIEKVILKLSDFGLSRFMPKGASTSSYQYTACGTRDYTSPEMLYAMDNNKRTKSKFSTDIFSLGVVIFEMITKHRPFTQEELRHEFMDVTSVVLDRERYEDNPVMFHAIVETDKGQSSLCQSLIGMLQWESKYRPSANQLLRHFAPMKHDKPVKILDCRHVARCIHYIDEANVIIVGSIGGLLYTFNSTGECKKVQDLFKEDITCMRHFNNFLIVGGFGGGVSLWEYSMQKDQLQLVRCIKEAGLRINCVDISEGYLTSGTCSEVSGYLQNGEYISVRNGKETGTLSVWRGGTDPVVIAEQEFDVDLEISLISNDRVFCGLWNGCLAVYDLASLSVVISLKLAACPIYSMTKNSGNTIYASTWNEGIFVIDADFKASKVIEPAADGMHQVLYKGEYLYCLTKFGQLKRFSCEDLSKASQEGSPVNWEAGGMQLRDRVILAYECQDMMQITDGLSFYYISPSSVRQIEVTAVEE